MKTIHTISAVLTCIISSFSLAENNQPQTNSVLTISIVEIISPSCNGVANGSITVEAQGGKTPYSFNWNTFPEQTTPTAVNLKKGVYFVQVTDAEGAVYFRSIELSDPLQTEVNYTSSMTSENRTVQVEFNSDKSENDYEFFLDGQPIHEPVLSDLDIGIHELIITDNHSCTVIQYIQVFEMEETSSSDTGVVKSDIGLTPIVTLETAEEQFWTHNITMK